MPQPAEVELTANRFAASFGMAGDRWRALLAATAGLSGPARGRALQAGIDRIFGDLDLRIRAHIQADLARLWIGGAVAVGAHRSLMPTARASLDAFALQSYGELLEVTGYVSETSKRALRKLAEAGALDALTGATANRAGLKIVDSLQDAARQVLSVTYRNGAVHSFADWADTAVRTQTALAYNGGALAQLRGEGIDWVELADGPDCGLTSHDDPELADGLVVPLSVADEYPLSHPRCARSILPRPDIEGPGGAEGHNSGRDPEELAARSLAERQRAARGTVTGRRMTVPSETRRVARRVREGRTARTNTR